MDPATIGMIISTLGSVAGKLGGGKDKESKLSELMQMLSGLNSFGSEQLPQANTKQVQIGGGGY